MKTFTKAHAHLIEDMPRWRKTTLTSAMRIEGAFSVVTREGTLECPDGYLAFDTHGWPYPIARDEFEWIYEPHSEPEE